jgi:hypothetical protein
MDTETQLFYQYMVHLKNVDHYDEIMLSNIESFTCEQKMILIRTMNQVIISLKDIIFIEPNKDIP